MFNVADMAITIGAALMVVYAMFFDGDTKSDRDTKNVRDTKSEGDTEKEEGAG